MQSAEQTNLILRDFRKTFDEAAHENLLLKLHFYCVRGNIDWGNALAWIKDFLNNRTQSVLLNGSNPVSTTVISDVPQGSALGPMLLLAYINDPGSGKIQSQTIRR